jgi:hypothetical protein
MLTSILIIKLGYIMKYLIVDIFKSLVILVNLKEHLFDTTLDEFTIDLIPLTPPKSLS